MSSDVRPSSVLSPPAERPATALGHKAATPGLFGGTVAKASGTQACQPGKPGHACDEVDNRCGPPPGVADPLRSVKLAGRGER